MKARPPSRTARNVAVWRALHLLRDPEPKVFRDTFARALAGFDSDEEMFEWVAGDPRASNRDTPFSFALRHRYAEDQLSAAIGRGVDQYVILGAGLDSFAQRNPATVAAIRVFEVDHPGSQQWKRDRIDALGLPVPEGLHYVPVDFEHQILTEELARAGLDPSRPTFFSCLGVTQYLTPEANADLLGQVARLTVQSTLVLEFIAPPATLAPDDAAVVKSISDGTAAMGEPWLSYFSFDDMEAALGQAGFGSVERFEASEALARYSTGHAPHIPGYFRMITAMAD